MLDDVAVGGPLPGNGSSDEAREVCDGRTGVGDLHGAAVGHGIEKSEEGDLMRGKTRISW